MVVHGHFIWPFGRAYDAVRAGEKRRSKPVRICVDDDAEEEERRLCYVGITRAQRELVFSMAKTRKRYQETLLQEPSRFLMELDPKLFSTPVIGEASLEQKGKMKKRSRSDFFQNLKQFNSQS